jgi:hypothetical protein
MQIMLPLELWDLIFDHRAALVLQRAWRRYNLFSHARRPGWAVIRERLRAANAWPSLLRFAMVRREWRLEPESWLVSCDVECIRREALDGLWGSCERGYFPHTVRDETRSAAESGGARQACQNPLVGGMRLPCTE